MSAVNPDSLTQFVDFTGCRDVNEAKKYVLMYDNDVGRAADRYFQAQNRAATSNGTHSNGRRDRSRDPVVIDDDAMEVESVPSSSSSMSNGRGSQPSSSCSSRRQHSTRSSSRNTAPTHQPDMDNGVRRPMARTRGTLVNESLAQSWRNGMAQARPSVFAAAAPDHQALARQQEAMLRSAGAGGSSSRAHAEALRKSQTLSDMYRPPVDITFIGPWEAARHNATAANLWLIANLQGANDFASACVNRDIWAKETVREILTKNFFFWQVADNIPDCERIKNYYDIKSYPAVFIVDPRTGELVGRLTQLKDASCFLEQMTNFLDKYPDFEAYDDELARRFGHPKPPAPAVEAAATPKKTKGKKRKAASPLEGEAAPSEDVSKKRARGHADAPVSSATATATATVDEEMPEIDQLCHNTNRVTTVDREEWRNMVPPASSTTPEVQMMIRLPNNEREKISVPSTTQLRAIFTFIEGRGLNSRDHLFVLTYPRREYTIEAHGSHTLASLGFNRQEVIHVDHK